MLSCELLSLESKISIFYIHEAIWLNYFLTVLLNKGAWISKLEYKKNTQIWYLTSFKGNISVFRSNLKGAWLKCQQ